MKVLTWVVFAIVIGLSITGSLADPDLWWHLTAGRWITGHHRLPTVDLWNRFGYGHPWVPYSWSFELVVGVLERIGGLTALLWGQVLLAIVVSLSVSYSVGFLAGDYFIGMLLGSLVTSGFVAQYTLRPQSVVWILFALLFVTAERLKRDPTRTAYRLGIFGIMAVWANLHITTVLGIGLIGAVFLDIKKPTALLLPVSIAFLGTLCTPHFGYEWIIFLSKSDHPLMFSAVAEFGPGTILDYPVGIYLIVLFALLTLLHQAPRSVPPGILLYTAGLSLGGLAVVKFLPFALIATAACFGYAWAAVQKLPEVPGALGNLLQSLQKLKVLVLTTFGPGGLFCAMAIALVQLNGIFRLGAIDKQRVPVVAMDFLEAHKLPRPIMNTFGDGGYVMYRLSSPETGELAEGDRVNIDGRTNVNDAQVMVENQEALNGMVTWRRYLDRIKPNTILWRNRSPLVSLLLMSPEWCRVFAVGNKDRGYSIFVRRESLETLPGLSCIEQSQSIEEQPTVPRHE